MRRFFYLTLMSIFFVLKGVAQNGTFPNYPQYNPPPSREGITTKGSPLLFDSAWAHAKVVSENNEVISNDSLLFNFNKLNQNLLLTQDYQKIYEVDKRDFKSVTFYWHDSVYIFEHVFAINKKDFFQEIIRDDKKYSLYKFIHTTIKPVNWHSNGLTTEGELYDQYVDDPVYYIIFPDKEYRILNKINRKSVEKAFNLKKDNQKVKIWLAGKNNNLTGEDLLWNLIINLNE
jgi:hypothetical protein